MNQFEIAIDFYKEADCRILAVEQNLWALEPGALTKALSMTPIESAVWECIREAPAVFYPQYPVYKYFADFTNPVARVAIECDGLEFHSDTGKDKQRDALFHELGYTVYRIPGRLCLSEYVESGELVVDPMGDEEAEEPVVPFTLRFIRAIAMKHGLLRGKMPLVDICEEMQMCLHHSSQGKLGHLGMQP